MLLRLLLYYLLLRVRRRRRRSLGWYPSGFHNCGCGIKEFSSRSKFQVKINLTFSKTIFFLHIRRNVQRSKQWTERDPWSCHTASSMSQLIAAYSTTTQDRNQEGHYVIHRVYSTHQLHMSSSLCICVCVQLCTILSHAELHIYLQKQENDLCHHPNCPLCYLLKVTPTSLPTISNPCKLLVYSPCPLLRHSECYINGNMQHAHTCWGWLLSPTYFP